MEEEAAELAADYLSRAKSPKPIVGFIAGQFAQRGRTHGHAGAIWNDHNESAQYKIQLWRRAGIQVAATLADVPSLIQAAATEMKIAVE